MKYLSLILICSLLLSCKKEDAKPSGSGYNVVLTYWGWRNVTNFTSSGVNSFTTVLVNGVHENYPVENSYTLNSGDRIDIRIDTALFDKNSFIEFQLVITDPITLKTDTSFYVFDYVSKAFQWTVPVTKNPDAFYKGYFGNSISIAIP